MEIDKLEKPIEDILRCRLQINDAQLSAICERFSIVELGLFGSALRDDFRVAGDNPSDIDLLVEFDPERQITWHFWLELQASFESLFRRKVDVVRKHLLTNPYRRAEILRTNCVIYEQP